MKRKYLYIILPLIALLWGCEEVKDWRDPTDDVPPGPITNVRVENLNGGARLVYNLPDDDDLMGAKAVYSFHENDIVREMYASAYTDTIVLDGYGDTEEHTVMIYAIDKSRNVSEGTPVTIRPLTAPIHTIRTTLNVIEAFGGVYVTWNNENRKEIAVSLYTLDEDGNQNLIDTYFSTAAEGANRFRGLPATEQRFRIEVYDRWNNYATPLDTTLTPMFEEEVFGKVNGVTYWKLLGMIDQSFRIRGDLQSYNPYVFDRIFDDDLFIDGSGAYWQVTNTPTLYFPELPNGTTVELWPMYFTVDMGRKASYSTLKIWMRDRSAIGHAFSANIMSDFEVWGTNNPKPTAQVGDGSREANLRYWTSWPLAEGTDEWKNDWEKLADCHVILPSGITKSYGYTALSDEDQQFVRDGFLFEMDPAMAGKAFRYLRFCIKSTNSDVPQIQMCEMRFWGAITKE
jgi:hypothetical protein